MTQKTAQPSPAAPLSEYTKRRDARQALANRGERRHVLMGNLRLAVFAFAAALGWLAFIRDSISGWWLLAPVVVFIALALVHDRVLKAKSRAERAVAFYERGLDRIEDRWAGKGEPGDRFEDSAHPYAEDLDIFGKGSLFELLNTTRLRVGEETLAQFLLHPAPPEEIGRRQSAIAELRTFVDLREDIALIGDDARSAVSSRALATWSERPPLLDAPRARLAAAVLAAFAAAGAAVWMAADIAAPFLAIVAVEAVFALRLRKRVLAVIEEVGSPAYGLVLLSEMLVRLERQRFTSPRLVALQEELITEGRPPSRIIAHLNRLMELLDSRDNVALRVIGPPLLYTTQVAFAIDSWRRHYGKSVRRWVQAAGEFEALCALANYSYEHPDDPFPEIERDGARFEGDELAHPLLPRARAVRNSVRLGPDVPVIVVSGSNMSGKSTLLRTVGVNVVLAMAGAPVRARRLRLSPLAIGASIRTMDSLQGGTSRFYAEITRLRLLVDIAKGPAPLLFLLDELLHGTNSHDRRLGAEAYVRGMAARGAIGLLTTHDMALAHIADLLQPPGANVHFQDHIEDGKMIFDYRMRPGVLTKSNALELMRSVGLEV